MILYSKEYYSLGLLKRVYGSAIPRAIPAAIISMIWTIIIRVFVFRQEGSSEFYDQIGFIKIGDFMRHPYPFQVFGFLVGFILVFRNNFGYQRFWEGRTSLQVFYSRLTDAVLQMYNFDAGTLKDHNSSTIAAHQVFRNKMLHLNSLLSGVAMQTLRTDFDLRNLFPHTQSIQIPPYDARHLATTPYHQKHTGYTTRGNNRHSLSSNITDHTTHSYMSRSKKHIRVRFGGLFRSFMLNTTQKDRLEYNFYMPIPVIGGISENEFDKLGGYLYENLGLHEDISRGTVDPAAQESKPGCGERVHVVASWLYQLIFERIQQGGLNVPAPVMARMFAIFSEAMQGYEQCRKIVDTPFPFPWSQLVMVLCIAFSFLLPFMIADFVYNIYYACVLEFTTSLIYWSLAEVSRDLEDPFVYDPNNLPLARLQFTFNERIIALTHNMRPNSTLETSAMHVTVLPELQARMSTEGGLAVPPLSVFAAASGMAHKSALYEPSGQGENSGSSRPPLSDLFWRQNSSLLRPQPRMSSAEDMKASLLGGMIV